MTSKTFIVQYYDYYGHLITTTLSKPTISTIIPSITYSATYSQVATVLSLSVSTSIESTGTFTGTVTLSALIDTSSTTELQIVILPTASQLQSHTQTSQTSQAATATSSQSPATPGARNTSGGLHGGAIAGIAIGVALATLFLFALGWCLVRRHRRRIESQSTRLNSSKSKRFGKAELEGTEVRSSEWQPRPELPGGEVTRADGPVEILSTTPVSTGHPKPAPARHELDAIPTGNISNPVNHAPSSLANEPPFQHLE